MAVPGYNRAWAVGDVSYTYQVCTRYGCFPHFSDKPLVEFWPLYGGWGIVASPNLNLNAGLSGVASIPTTLTAWAVGSGTPGNAATLIEKWNGPSWAVVASPYVGNLSDVAATGPTNAWAVGDNSSTLAMHWNGTSWSVVTTPNAGVYGSALYGVATTPGSVYLWAVGTYLTSANGNTFRPLAELLHC